MSELTLHWDILSQPSRTVKVVLLLGKIPHTTKDYQLFKQDHKTEEFKKINPACQVPALTIGDLSIAESNAILNYLTSCYEFPDTLYNPKEPKARAKLDQMLEWIEDTVRPAFIGMARLLMAKVAQGIEPSEATMTSLAQAQDTSLKQLDYFITQSGGPFLLGEKPSAADIKLFHELTICDFLKKSLMEHPAIMRLNEKLLEIPAMKETHEKYLQAVAEMQKTIHEMTQKKKEEDAKK